DIADSPLGFFKFKTEVLGSGQRGSAGLTGDFPARGSPAARVEGCVSLTGSRRTSGCLESRLGRSEVGCRRRAAACGLGAQRRGSSGEVWARGSGLGARAAPGAPEGARSWGRGSP